ncbi:carbohydrate esterase family 9 protein [Vararia minispora EC-137]|uniref:Carbohydrate esterase family 9 protein n=1 Tax=Vararia minispora EC-137 TaxID=1314806 RepID=A0ACB8QD96_9AGAM|nr:carbohydrate esterase family 9 protein [Vararia minispora EC-137]
MTKDVLPVSRAGAPGPELHRRHGKLARRLAGLLFVLAAAQACFFLATDPPGRRRGAHVPLHAQEALEKCVAQTLVAGPAPDFRARTVSDRFVQGTPAVLVRGAKIWTGAHNGTEVLEGDILLEDGLIKTVGSVTLADVERRVRSGALKVVDANGAWVTPGLVDNHSHLGVYSAPALNGAADGNSHKGPILPWLRSLDALNTHDDAYALSIAGGVTTAAVLPGSANAIGGQAFTIKLRKTLERSPTAMLVDPPFDINRTRAAGATHTPWRQMKHACGENPSRVYSNTRMDTFWAFREAYNKASEIKAQQDAYCTKALAGEWDGLGPYPEDLQWEALVDVIRGRVKVQAHCYEAVDLDDLIRLTNEFQFPIAAVHHAHEAYLVPDVLKRAYGHPPAAAIFAVNARYKRESYRGSEYAPRILADSGIDVVMKSDHPVLNSRYLMFEAQQAHYYGLPENLAIASVTSTPATVLGLDHRVGYIKEGWDADLILWDSHPLSLGATPTQVFIDGIPQLDSPVVLHKPEVFQHPPRVPNFDREANETLRYEGLPPLAPTTADTSVVVFVNVKSVTVRAAGDLQEVYTAEKGRLGSAVVVDGVLSCYGHAEECAIPAQGEGTLRVVDLRGGSIEPGLTTFGSDLGLSEIRGEASTRDGFVYDPLLDPVPSAAGGDDALVRAVDGLRFAGRDTLLAYRYGVTKAVAVPLGGAFLKGLGAFFSTSAAHKLDTVGVIQPITALHVQIAHIGTPSVSTQIAALRKKLLALPADTDEEIARAFEQVARGVIPVVVHTDNADVIATVITLKKEVEEKTGARLRVTIAGGAESHLLAEQLKAADVGVVILSTRPFPGLWESQRILPGPPLSNGSTISTLLNHNVNIGVGVTEAWMARNTRLDVAWAALESGGGISKAEALALATTNLERLLGVERYAEAAELVVTEGGDLLSLESKVVGVISPARRSVDLF